MAYFIFGDEFLYTGYIFLNPFATVYTKDGFGRI